jgi:hypothetical protein
LIFWDPRVSRRCARRLLYWHRKTSNLKSDNEKKVLFRKLRFGVSAKL